MTHHSELINFLAKKINAKSYLEIGTFNRDHNFNLINVKHKICVDPDSEAKADFIGTSDKFFEFYKIMSTIENYGKPKLFDIIFIDGLHEEAQVRKDFENALQCLNDNGFIILHDCNPHSEAITHYPRDSREWCGNVYKFAMTLQQYDGIDFRTVNFDYGCAVVWKDETKTGNPKKIDTTWENFEDYRKELLRLVSVEEFKSHPNIKKPVSCINSCIIPLFFKYNSCFYSILLVFFTACAIISLFQPIICTFFRRADWFGNL